MKKIMVYAYTKLNFGDDLFIKVLCDRYQNTKFIIYSNKEYKNAYKNIGNLKYYSRDSIITRSMDYISRKVNLNWDIEDRLLNSCDAIVNIGGSMFIEWDGWESQFNKIIKKRFKNNKPFYLLGCNFGPYRSLEYFNSYKKLFSKYTDICFREDYSYKLFSDLNNVRRADDIIFQLNKKQHVDIRNEVIVSVIKPSFRKDLERYDEIYYEKIKDISIYFIERGINVKLMSFCKYEGDEEAISKIIDMIPSKYITNISKYFYRGNVDEALKMIEESKYIIATRFHSMILGWVFDKPVLPIVYSKKMINVIEDIKFKGEYIELKNIEGLDVEKIFKNIQYSKIDITKQIESSKLHFKKLDKYLNYNQ